MVQGAPLQGGGPPRSGLPWLPPAVAARLPPAVGRHTITPPHPLSRPNCSGLWAIGVLAVLTSLFGLVVGCCRVRCCLSVYITLAVLATAAQAGFVLYLFIDPAHAEEQVASYQRASTGAVK